MSRFEIIVAASSLCLANLSQAQASPDGTSGDPTITVTEVNASDQVLKLRYEIRNESGQDIWIYEGVRRGYKNFEVYMAEDDETLLLCRRLDVPITGFGEYLSGQYRCIRKNAAQKESLLLPLPVNRRVFMGGRWRSVKGVEHAKRLAIEIGFYSGDLPRMIFRIFEEGEKDSQGEHHDEHGYPTDIIGWLGGPVWFNKTNESLQDRDEQVIIGWSNQTLKGEQILRATVDDLNIPYIEWPSSTYLDPKPLNLIDCTRIEIRYEPSMLDYFFPYGGQRRLLGEAEIKYLQSQKEVVVDDRELIRAMNDAINNRAIGDAHIVTEFGTAHVTCYRDDEHLTALTVYDDAFIETEEKERLWYGDIVDPPSMRVLTPEIAPFDLRMKCAVNITNLWHRLRSYSNAERIPLEKSSAESRMIYPLAGEWCDLLVRACRAAGSEEWSTKAHKCPSTGEGKGHYAMNSTCKPDSPANMVLLFETKAGWNQHGGPELFTFDNHDPKGGCVLLNDGTVKFIRTEEDLRQLRWK